MKKGFGKGMKKPAAGMVLLLTATSVMVPSAVRPETVLAEDVGDSVIKNTPTGGTLTIRKTDTANKEQTINGVGYTAYKIISLTPGANVGEFASYEVVSDYSEALPGIGPDALGNYPTAELEKVIQELDAIAEKQPENAGIKSTPGEAGEAVLNLPIGWYLVRETNTPSGTIAGAPFLVAMPSTDNVAASNATEHTVGTKWIYEITAAPKSPKITVDKKIINGGAEYDSKFGTDLPLFEGKADTVGLGDMVQYSVTATVPTYDQSYYYNNANPTFEINDTMSVGLTIQKSETCPVEVKVDGNAVPERVQDGSENYEVTVTPKDADKDGADLSVKFKNAFLQNELYMGKQVTVTYYAQVNENAVMGTTGNTNNVVLRFERQPGVEESESPVPDEEEAVVPDTYVYTYGIKVDKFAEGEKTPLSGAKFKLYKDSELTEALKDANEEDLVLETEGGSLQFSRLDAGTYYLKEVESPSGYSLLANPVKVELIPKKDGEGKIDDGTFMVKVNDASVDETENGEHMTKFSVDTGIVSVAIENHKGFSLPATGGSGIFLLVAISAIGLVTLTFFVLKPKKKVG